MGTALWLLLWAPIVPVQGGDAASRIATVATGRCAADETFAIALHGGSLAGRGHHDPQLVFLRETLTQTRAALAAGAIALDIVEAAVAELEDSGLYNAGKGAIANKAGVIELDASIMEGRRLKAGAVASVKAVRNPIAAARLVMDRSRHVLMVGPDADRFVLDQGGAAADVSYFLHGGANYSDVPLPDDIKIIPPAAHVSRNRAAFSGAWGGVWAGDLNHILVVETIDAEKASMVYALGPFTDYGAGFHYRLSAPFTDDGMKVAARDRSGDWDMVFRLTEDDTLAATATNVRTGDVFKTTFGRIDLSALDKDSGTVGAVVRDRCGDLAAGTSTGGFGSKTPGRVGDSPIIGAGTYANNETVAVSATGHGEYFIRHVVAYAISAVMQYQGLTVEQATEKLIEQDLKRQGLRGGVIAVDSKGNLTASFNTPGMLRGTASDKQAPEVAID